MPDDFMITDRGLFERTMKRTTAYAKLLLQAMTINAGPDGIVKGSVEHWSSYLEYPPVPIDQIELAIAQLEAPDARSTSEAEEGRRIVPVGNNTWRVVNYFKYKYELSQERKRALSAASTARYRARQQYGEEAAPKRVPGPRPISEASEAVSLNGALPAQKEAPVALDAEKAEVAALVAAEPPRIRVPLELWQKYRSQNRLKPYKPLGMKGLIKRLRGFADPQDAVEFSISMNYQGVFERGGEQEKRLTMAERHERDMGEIKERMGL